MRYIFNAVILSLKSIRTAKKGEFKHEVRQFQKPYDNQQAEQILDNVPEAQLLIDSLEKSTRGIVR